MLSGEVSFVFANVRLRCALSPTLVGDAELTARGKDNYRTYMPKQTPPSYRCLFADDGVLLGLASMHPELQTRFNALVTEIRRHGGQESRKKSSHLVCTGAARYAGTRALHKAKAAAGRENKINRVRAAAIEQKIDPEIEN